MSTASPHATLQDELKLINCLIDLMTQERACLVAANSDGLNALTPRKSQLIEQLAQQAGQRHQRLGAAGFAAAETGMDAWLAGAGDRAAYTTWQELLRKTREAKELNRVNGMLINKQLTHNQTLINAMRAPAGAADTGFYGPSGQAAPGHTTRRLVVG